MFEFIASEPMETVFFRLRTVRLKCSTFAQSALEHIQGHITRLGKRGTLKPTPAAYQMFVRSVEWHHTP